MKRNTDIRWCQAADCKIRGTANWRRVKRTNEMAGVLPIDWPVSCSDGFSFAKLVPHQFDSSGRAGSEKEKKEKKSICKVRPRSFSLPGQFCISCSVLPVDRGTSVFHRKKIMQLLAPLQAVGQALVAPLSSVYGLISLFPFHVSTVSQ